MVNTIFAEQIAYEKTKPGKDNTRQRHSMILYKSIALNKNTLLNYSIDVFNIIPTSVATAII